MNNQEKEIMIKDQQKEIQKWKKIAERRQKIAKRHELFGLEMIKVWVDTSSDSSLKKLSEIQDKAEREANLMYP